MAKKQQAMLLLNRRGFSRSIICYKCGWQMRCNHCDVALTAHKGLGAVERRTCAWCVITATAYDPCRRSVQSALVRISGERSGYSAGGEDAAGRFSRSTYFAHGPRHDRSRTSHADILSAFFRQEADILLGTQMIAKGHDFHNVTLSAVLSADQMLGTGDYRMPNWHFN